MATTSAVRFEIVEKGARRVVTAAPPARPDLHLPEAHPARPVAPGRSQRAASCAVERPSARPSAWLAVKVAAVAALAILGTAVSGQSLVLAEPNPAAEYVAGHPAWAHVTAP